MDEYEPVEGQHGAPFATLKDASGNIISPATEDKLEQVRQLLAGVATEAKLEQARTLLDAINTKDFATQTTLAAVLAKLADLESELATIKANQISGDQKVTLSGTIVEVVALAQGFEITAGSKVFVPTNNKRSYLDTASMAIRIMKTNTEVGIHNHPIKVWFWLGDIAHGRVELYNGALSNYRRIIPRFEMPFPEGVFEIENGDTETTKLDVWLYKYRT